eukprot:972023-Prymnesium_polylepis.2
MELGDSDALLERAAERANTAHQIYMLMDADADGLVGVEQVGESRNSERAHAGRSRACGRGGAGIGPSPPPDG